MAPLPKRRHSSARQAKRTRALSLGMVSLIVCSNCGKMKPAHIVCPTCGFYAGKAEVIKKTKETTKAK